MSPLRILLVHSAYQHPGGEDSVVESEFELLRSHGNPVQILRRSNSDVDAMGRLALAVQTIWSRPATTELHEYIRSFQPELIHVHNTLPLISPSIYWAADRVGIPVVQTLHNFRLLCPQAMLLRDGRVCEACIGTVPWRAVVHRCYRNSVGQTGAVAAMLQMHRLIGTYQRKITRYIAMNEFSRRKFIEGGLPAERISTKPHFVDIPRPIEVGRRGALYVGRLSPEKGISLIVDAMALLEGWDVSVIGTGPEEQELSSSGARLLGYREQAEVYAHMQRSAYLLIPSICYENSPRTLTEAFACGLPVIASRHGSMAELIEPGVTGLLFEPNSTEDLVAKIRWAEEHPEQIAQMGLNARAEYEAKYTPELNYELLIDIYTQAISEMRTYGNRTNGPNSSQHRWQDD